MTMALACATVCFVLIPHCLCGVTAKGKTFPPAQERGVFTVKAGCYR